MLVRLPMLALLAAVAAASWLPDHGSLAGRSVGALPAGSASSHCYAFGRSLSARLSSSSVAASSAAASTTTWCREAWDATAWEGTRSIDRHQLLQGLLDGGLTAREANHAAWRGLGYKWSNGAMLLAPDGTPCAAGASLPDVLGDADTLARLEATLPLDDEDEVACLDTLVDTLHGEELTRALVAEGDADFLARRTLVRWLYSTQPGLRF